MTTVNAAVYTAQNTIKYIKNYTFDQPYREDDIHLQVLSAGICGSDMHAYHGKDPRRQPKLILGHEFGAKVLEGSLKDKIVTANPLIVCGKCIYCKQGRDNLCINRDMIGMNRQGAFANFISVPRQCLVVAPNDIDPSFIALTEPAATVVHGINLVKKTIFSPLDNLDILIIGGGAIGFLTALLLKNDNNITVFETNKLRLQEITKHIGVKAVNPVNNKIIKNCFDLVIDCVGSKITRKTSLESINPGGVILHIGLQDNASEIDMRKLTLSEITIIGTYTYTMNDFKDALNLISNGSFGNLSWVLEESLSNASTMFQQLNDNQIASAKVILKP